MLTSVVAADCRGGRGGGRGELQLVLAAVPVGAGHGDVQAEHHKLQPEEADVRVEFGELVLAGAGVCEGRGEASVLYVAGVVSHLQTTVRVPQDTASPKPSGAGTIC